MSILSSLEDKLINSKKFQKLASNRLVKGNIKVLDSAANTAVDIGVRGAGRLATRNVLSAYGIKEYNPKELQGSGLRKTINRVLIGNDRVTNYKQGNAELNETLSPYVGVDKAKFVAPALIAAGTILDAEVPGLDDIAKGGLKIGAKKLATKEASKIIAEKAAKNIAEDVVKSNADEVLETAAKKIGKKSVEKKGIKATVGKAADKFITDWDNAWHPLEKYADKIQKASGVEIAAEDSVKYKIKRYLGSAGMAKFRHNKELKPILAEARDIGKDNFEVYLKAMRDLGFEKTGRKIKDVDFDEARRVVTAMNEKYGADRIKQLEATAAKLYKFQDESLQKLRNTGFIDEATYKVIRDKNVNYVPYKRVMDSIDESLGIGSKSLQVETKPSMLKELKGSERQIKPPLESIIEDTYKIEALVAKNELTKSVVGLKNYFDDGSIKVLRSASNVKSGKKFKNISAFDKHTISTWRDGVKEIYEVPAEIESVIKGLDQESMDFVTKLASNITGTFRQGQTGRNIDFMIPNIFKDQLDAALTAKYGYTPFVDYFRGLAHLVNYDVKGSDALVETWIKNGGDIAFSKAAGKMSADEIMGVAQKKNAWGKVSAFLDVVGRYSEVPTRLGVADKALKKSGSIAEAVIESREATVDFARMGAKMRVANAFIPFLNPSIQGFSKLLRVAKNNPKKFAVALVAYGGLPATLLSLYNNAYHGEEYASVPAWEKENNFVFMTGGYTNGRPSYVKFPKGNIVPLIANPVDSFITHLYNNDRQSFNSMLISLFSGMTPVIGDGTSFKEVGTRTLGNIVPQPIKPLVEASSNYDFFKGKQIDSPGMLYKEPEERYTDSTPDTYVAIGKALNMSPRRVEKILEGYFASGAKTPADLLQVLTDVRNGEEIDTNMIPILRRFFGNYESYEDTDTGSSYSPTLY